MRGVLRRDGSECTVGRGAVTQRRKKSGYDLERYWCESVVMLNDVRKDSLNFEWLINTLDCVRRS
jgi:hypothetical protein